MQISITAKVKKLIEEHEMVFAQTEEKFQAFGKGTESNIMSVARSVALIGTGLWLHYKWAA